MRVLGEEAVKDPTAVEARVNRDIAERHAKHVEANEERKLTKEQKHENDLREAKNHVRHFAEVRQVTSCDLPLTDRAWVGSRCGQVTRC